MKTRTEMIKSGEIKLVPVYGVWNGRYYEGLERPARYYDLEGELHFVMCRKCGKGRVPEKLVKHSPSPQGVQAICIECDRKQSREWGHRDNNAHKRNQRNRAKYGARTPQEIAADQLRLHPDGMSVCRKCKENRPVSEYSSHRGKPDGLAEMCTTCDYIARMERKYKKFHKWWEEQGRELSCVYCGGAFEHIDHCISRHNGGADEHSNYVPACGSCNCSKNGSWLADWYPAKYGEDAWNALQLKLKQYGIVWE